MDLLDRYLRSVQWLLPKAQRQDIMAELSEDIRSEIEDKEAELGRKLGEAELEAILQRWGHPTLVAGRYLPQRYLIGPTLFPIYLFVLKLVSLVYLIPWLLVWLFLVTFVPSYRTDHPGFALLGTLESFVLMAVFCFTVITLIFAAVEKSQAKNKLLERWSPRKLPEVKDLNRISRSESIGDLAGGVVFLLLWLGVLRLPSIPELPITPAGVWTSFYWPILLVAVASTTMAAINVWRPRWTRLRSSFQLAIHGAGLALVCVLLASGPWFEVAISGPPSEKAEMLASWINLSAAITIAVFGILFLVSIVRGARRLSDSRTSKGFSGSPGVAI